MGKSSRSNRQKALGTERRRHLEVAQWQEKSAQARAEALAKCVAAEPVPVKEVAAGDADVMETEDRGRQGVPEAQQQARQQGKKKRRGRGGDGMEVEAPPLKKKLPGRGSLKGLNKRAGEGGERGGSSAPPPAGHRRCVRQRALPACPPAPCTRPAPPAALHARPPGRTPWRPARLAARPDARQPGHTP
jgi:hypothetical protein